MIDVNKMLKSAGHDPLHAADNKIPLNRHRVVTDQKIGYLYAVPPQIDLDNDTLSQEVNEDLSDRWGKVIRQLGTDATNTGKGWLAYWEEDGEFKFWYINPKTACPIYDYSKPKKEMILMLRYYEVMLPDGKPGTRYEVWDNEQVAFCVRPNDRESEGVAAISFEMSGEQFNIQPHSYGRIPFIEFDNNAIHSSDLEMYKEIIDSLDKIVSGGVNDLDDIQEIIWVIKNYAGDTEFPVYNKDGTPALDENGNQKMQSIDIPLLLKLKKAVSVQDNGGVEAIHNEIPYEARKEFFEMLDKLFWCAAMAVNPNPESLGNQSGVYLEYLYGSLEHKAALQEVEFRPAINEFIRAYLKFKGKPEDTKITQVWKRTRPQNIPEIVSALADTPSEVMSDESKTKVHPLVNDWQAEREQINKEQAERDKKQKEMFGGDEEKEEVDDDTDGKIGTDNKDGTGNAGGNKSGEKK